MCGLTDAPRRELLGACSFMKKRSPPIRSALPFRRFCCGGLCSKGLSDGVMASCARLRRYAGSRVAKGCRLVAVGWQGPRLTAMSSCPIGPECLRLKTV